MSEWTMLENNLLQAQRVCLEISDLDPYSEKVEDAYKARDAAYKAIFIYITAHTGKE